MSSTALQDQKEERRDEQETPRPRVIGSSKFRYFHAELDCVDFEMGLDVEEQAWASLRAKKAAGEDYKSQLNIFEDSNVGDSNPDLARGGRGRPGPLQESVHLPVSDFAMVEDSDGEMPSKKADHGTNEAAEDTRPPNEYPHTFEYKSPFMGPVAWTVPPRGSHQAPTPFLIWQDPETSTPPDVQIDSAEHAAASDDKENAPPPPGSNRTPNRRRHLRQRSDSSTNSDTSTAASMTDVTPEIPDRIGLGNVQPAIDAVPGPNRLVNLAFRALTTMPPTPLTANFPTAAAAAPAGGVGPVRQEPQGLPVAGTENTPTNASIFGPMNPPPRIFAATPLRAPAIPRTSVFRFRRFQPRSPTRHQLPRIASPRTIRARMGGTRADGLASTTSTDVPMTDAPDE